MRQLVSNLTLLLQNLSVVLVRHFPNYVYITFSVTPAITLVQASL